MFALRQFFQIVMAKLDCPTYKIPDENITLLVTTVGSIVLNSGVRHEGFANVSKTERQPLRYPASSICGQIRLPCSSFSLMTTFTLNDHHMTN